MSSEIYFTPELAYRSPVAEMKRHFSQHTENEYKSIMNMSGDHFQLDQPVKKHSEQFYSIMRSETFFRRTDLVERKKTSTIDFPSIELRRSLLEGSIHESVDLQCDHTTQEAQKARRQNVQINRLAKIQRLRRMPKQVEAYVWSWDTSGALIRLMKRSRTTRFIMNIYIWVLLLLRVYYFATLIKYMIEQKLNFPHNSLKFFWAVFSVYFGIRVLFIAIILKILSQGHRTSDQKIKIVYETYRQVIDQCTSITSRRALIAGMILTPPEFSFFYLRPGQKKTASGYYQVQNMIMKSLEVFFFVPFLLYFLINKDLFDFEQILNLKANYEDYNIWIGPVLVVDSAIFLVLIFYLLINNQRRKKSFT